jgi:hypothetical protein
MVTLDDKRPASLTASMDAALDDAGDRSLRELANSARGWHGVQLAVLAFIGLCGVLSDVDPAMPRWLQVTAGALAAAALIASCLSIFIVARVAWPFSSRAADGDVPQEAARRLRTGIALTYVAVGLMALAASSSWWPSPDGARIDGSGATVRITDQAGRTACGTIIDGPTATIRLATADGPIELAATGLADIVPVDGC